MIPREILKKIRQIEIRTNHIVRASFCLALILSGFLSGCASATNPKLEAHRQSLSAAYQDDTRPLLERVKAFDDLIETFTDGTREEVVDRYINYGCFGTDLKTRVVDDYFMLCLHAPDGSDRKIPMKNDKVKRD